MRYQLFLYTTFLSILLPLFTSAEPHGPSHRRHNALAKNRKRTSLELEAFHRRDNGARATFYDVGLGACGKFNSPGDFIVALNSCEYGGGSPGPQCFKMITIEYQGKQTQAQIMDECPGCPCGGLDMSRGLFTYFAPESTGVFYMNWWYSDGGSPPPAPSPPPPPPKPSSTWIPPPTSSSVWVDPSPWTSKASTSTWSPPSSTTSSSSSSSSWSSSSSSSYSSSSSSTSHNSVVSKTSSSPSSTPTITPTPAAAENLQDVNELFSKIGGLVVQYGL